MALTTEIKQKITNGEIFTILIIGDVFAKPGRECLLQELPGLCSRYNPELVIVNGENAAHGYGIKAAMVEQFFSAGADVITSGNHIWDHKEIITKISEEPRLLRPLNYPACQPGGGYFDAVGKKKRTILKPIRVINLAGRLGMGMAECPFIASDSVVRMGTPQQQGFAAIIVDFHAEMTSEKNALGHYLDGRCSAVVGTHTHIPTADQRVLAAGTGYCSDLGMTGNYASVIGMMKRTGINRFLGTLPRERMEPAGGTATLSGVLLGVAHSDGLAAFIEPIRLGPELTNYLPEL